MSLSFIVGCFVALLRKRSVYYLLRSSWRLRKGTKSKLGEEENHRLLRLLVRRLLWSPQAFFFDDSKGQKRESSQQGQIGLHLWRGESEFLLCVCPTSGLSRGVFKVKPERRPRCPGNPGRIRRNPGWGRGRQPSRRRPPNPRLEMRWVRKLLSMTFNNDTRTNFTFDMTFCCTN